MDTLNRNQHRFCSLRPIGLLLCILSMTPACDEQEALSPLSPVVNEPFTATLDRLEAQIQVQPANTKQNLQTTEQQEVAPSPNLKPRTWAPKQAGQPGAQNRPDSHQPTLPPKKKCKGRTKCGNPVPPELMFAPSKKPEVDTNP